MLLHISAKHFVAGLVFDSNDERTAVCVRAAPIVKYARGWTYHKCRAWFGGRGYRIRVIKSE